jgi:tetrahydromethanopterin S-methyltransferase subunit E
MQYRTEIKSKSSAILSTLKKTQVWVQIMLSYTFISAIIATLICAYLQESKLTVIFPLLLIGSSYGVIKAESIRKSMGLVHYQMKMTKFHAKG